MSALRDRRSGTGLLTLSTTLVHFDEMSDVLDYAQINIDGKRIVLFDGVCNLCNAAVQWIIRRDRKGYFQFASLQSQVAREILARHQYSNAAIDSLVVVADGRVYFASDAILYITQHVDGMWRLLDVFTILPKPFRDGVYFAVANRRFRWFGRRDVCQMPAGLGVERFLDNIEHERNRP